MNVKTFQAVDMKEAIAKIKAAMGPDAIIISSRKVNKSSGTFGMFARPLIEVTAAMDHEVREEKEKAHGRKPEHARRHGNLKRKGSTVETAVIEPITGALDPLRVEIAELREMITTNSNNNSFGRTELKKAAQLSDEMENMTSMFNLMIEESDLKKGLGMETNFLICYRRMIERGIEPQFARTLINKVKDEVPGAREIDLRTIIDGVVEHIAESMFVGEPISPNLTGPRVATLIGPTGVGKTTTIAKIAADLTLEGKSVGLITIDTYRIAAVEQLRIYAGILNIPLEVVLTPDELVTAIHNYDNKDVILIDTAGRSQRDMDKIDELASFFSDDETIENYLVLSASSESSTVDEAVRNFGSIPLSGLIFTKMDETTKPGIVISQNFKTGLPVVYTTNGQKVPEDIEKASPKKLAVKLFKKEL